MSKFLPIHPRMIKQRMLKKGMTIIHNGGNGRQGSVAKIERLDAKIVVKFTDTGVMQSYSWDWFSNNFWIHSTAIYSMKGVFNGDGYWMKYYMYSKTQQELRNHCFTNHAMMKHEQDEIARKRKQEAKNANLDEQFEEVLALESSSDEVGTFLSCRVDGNGVPTMHKTLRMAEFKAQQESGRDGAERHILKVVSVVKAKPITSYEVSTERK